MITLTGFLFIVVNFIHLTYHDNYFYASDNTHPEYTPVPAWVWLVTAIFIFVAHVLGRFNSVINIPITNMQTYFSTVYLGP